jgi:hypothetical protein
MTTENLLERRDVPYSEVDRPALTHHTLVLATRPPEELDLMYEGVKRHVPPPAGSIMLVPAGCPSRWRWRGRKDSLHIYLEPGLVARVAALAFGLDPARLTVPPLDGLDLPYLRAAMGAVDAELTADVAGGEPRRRVPGQPPGRLPDPACPGTPPAGARAGRRPAAGAAPRRRRVHRGAPRRRPVPGADGRGRPR